jgi:hypothetical protein
MIMQFVGTEMLARLLELDKRSIQIPPGTEYPPHADTKTKTTSTRANVTQPRLKQMDRTYV